MKTIRAQFGTRCINCSSDRWSHSSCDLEPYKHSSNTVFVVFKGDTCTPEMTSTFWELEFEIFEENNPDCGSEIFKIREKSITDSNNNPYHHIYNLSALSSKVYR
ncbi:MAG: hypothetical protein WBX01_02320 [Nitrososphaeraceae archaeon]